MSEVKDDKITSVEKTKNPKRVEAGKKLGAISRQAKEAKEAKGASEASAASGVVIPTFDPLTAVGVVGVIGMIVYYGYNNSKESPKESPKEENQAESVTPQVVVAKPAKRKELDSLD